MDERMSGFVAWAYSEEQQHRNENFQGYVHGVSLSRYIIRKVMRIADDAARRAGLDPLSHQALIQIFGSGPQHLTISQLAERLDIVPAFASRLTKDLEARGLVRRERSDEDRRIIRIMTTAAGIERLRDVDTEVRFHARYFQEQLSEDQRAAAMMVFAFMVGYTTDPLRLPVESTPTQAVGPRPLGARTGQ